MDDRSVMHAMGLDDAYHVERVLAQRNGCVTELVTLNGAGPYVRRRVPADRVDRATWAALASCESKRLPRVIATYEMPDSFTVITEYIPGETLERLIEREGPIAADGAARIMDQLCDAVEELHAHGVVHRDIAPGNVIVNENGAHLIDPGIARLPSAGARRDTTVLGTHGFAAPEQYGFAQTDARSDVYALGKLLEYALAGEAAGDAPQGTKKDAKKDAEETAKEGAVENQRGVSPRLREVIERACAFEPSARYQDVAAFRKALDAAIGGTNTPAREAGQRKERGIKAAQEQADVGAHPWTRSAVAIALPVVAIGGIASFLTWQAGLGKGEGEGGSIAANGSGAPEPLAGEIQDAASAYAPTSTSGDAVTPEILDTGWSVNTGTYADCAGAAKNPDPSHAIDSPSVRVTGKDESGAVLFTDTLPLPPMAPGETVYFAGSVGGADEIPRAVEFQAAPSETTGDVEYLRKPTFEVTGARVGKGSLDGLTSFTGTTVAQGSYDALTWTSASACVILRDDAGRIVYGWTAYIDIPEPGRETPFQIEAWNVPAYKAYEIHVQALM